MEDIPNKPNILIKTDEIFLKYKYERIPTNFGEKAEKGFLNSNISTRASYKKLDFKEKETENNAENKTFCESLNNEDIINEEETCNEYNSYNLDHNNIFNIESKGLIERKNSSLKNSLINNNSYKNKLNIKNKVFVRSGDYSFNNSNKPEQSKKLVGNSKEYEDIIPFSIKIIYSLASFGKMSCLVLLKYFKLIHIIKY